MEKDCLQDPSLTISQVGEKILDLQRSMANYTVGIRAEERGCYDRLT